LNEEKTAVYKTLVYKKSREGESALWCPKKKRRKRDSLQLHVVHSGTDLTFYLTSRCQ